MKNLPRILSICVGARGLIVAEVTRQPSSVRVKKIMHVPYPSVPSALSLATPAELGQHLAHLLHDGKIGLKDAVIGLPAKRLMAKTKEVPAASVSMIRSSLRLQAEMDFPSEPTPFVTDAAGISEKGGTALLVGTPQETLEQCFTLAKSAGLRLQAVTSTGLELSHLLGGGRPNTPYSILFLSPQGAEFAAYDQHGPMLLRHLPLTDEEMVPENTGVLTAELRRILATMPESYKPRELLLWDVRPQMTETLSQRLGMPVKLCDIAKKIPMENGSRAFSFEDVPLLSISQLPPQIDFQHSQLAPPREHRFARPYRIAALVVIILLLLVGWGIGDIRQRSTELEGLKNLRNANAEKVAAAQDASDRLKFARTWHSGQSFYVMCLRDITVLFPDDTTIWATSLNVQLNGACVLSGKATGEQPVRTLLNKMLNDKKFTDAKVIDLRDISRTTGGGSSGERSFSISFTYQQNR